MTLSWTNLDNDVTNRCLVGFSGDRPDMKNAVCQLSTHVGTVNTRGVMNVKRLLRCFIGNRACNMIVGCNLDVPGIAGIPQGSLVVMTDADWAGDVKKTVAAFLEFQFGSKILLKTRGIPCMRPPRSRTWIFFEFWRIGVDGTGWWNL